LDSPQSVAAAVAAILDAGSTPEERDLPQALQELKRIRSAARRILDANLRDDQNALLGALARRAARAELAEWAMDAIVLEIRGPQGEALDHSFIKGQERMRRARFETCPICLHRVLGDTELDALKMRNKRAADDLAAWQGAAE